MMSETPPKDIVDKWEHCARRFGTLYASRYLPEKTTPYMHVFVHHVGYFLKTLGIVITTLNLGIESTRESNLLRLWHLVEDLIQRKAAWGSNSCNTSTGHDLPILTLGKDISAKPKEREMKSRIRTYDQTNGESPLKHRLGLNDNWMPVTSEIHSLNQLWVSQLRLA